MDGENVLEVPVEIEVLHPVLEDLPDVQFAMLYTVSPFGQYFKKKKYFNLETRVIEFYKELRAHGMTAISPKNSDWPYRPGHIEGLKAEVKLALRAGIKGPVLWYMSSLINGAKGGKLYSYYDGKCDNWNEERDLANLKDIVITTKEAERKESWPEVVFIPVDEPGTMTENRKLLNLRMNILEKTLKVINEMGARGAVTLSEPVDERHNKAPFVKTLDELRKKWGKSRPYADIRIYNYGFPQGETNLYYEKSDSEQRGHEVWFYNNKAIIGNDRYVARVYYGLWGWKVKPAGLTSWTYPGARTIQWEIVREGIDDFKYLRLIERLFREKPVHDVNRKYAEEFLEEISESVKLDDNGFIKDWNKWENYDFDEFRKSSIEIIKSLSR